MNVEGALDHLNALLASSRPDEAIPPSDKQVCLVVGPPRSGTTALMQRIVTTTDWPYPTNLIARFWGDPRIGAAVQQSVYGHVRPTYTSSGDSKAGETAGPLEPHEFGRFWSATCGVPYGSAELPEVGSIDWTAVVAQVAALSAALGGRVALKGFHVLPFLREFASAYGSGLRVLRIKRSAEDVIASLVRLRSYDYRYREWAGPSVPGLHERLTGEVARDCAMQVEAIEHHLDAVLAELPLIHHTIQYDSLTDGSNLRLADLLGGQP